MYLPPLVPGGTHSIAGEGVGGPNSDEGTDTVVFYMYVCIHVLCGFGEILVTELLFNKLFSLHKEDMQPHPVFIFDILFSVVGSNWLCKVRGGEGQRQTIHPSEYSNKNVYKNLLRAWSKSCILPTKTKVKASFQEEKPPNHILT